VPGDPSTWIATNMTLLPDVPAVHGPFVLWFSRHLSRLLLKGLGSYRKLGAVLPLFSESPRRGVLGNRNSSVGSSRLLRAYEGIKRKEDREHNPGPPQKTRSP
jgi:hypothetical protein